MGLRAYYWRVTGVAIAVPAGTTLVLAWVFASPAMLGCGACWGLAVAAVAVWTDRMLIARIVQAAARANAVSLGDPAAPPIAHRVRLAEFTTLDDGISRADRGLRAAIRLLRAA